MNSTQKHKAHRTRSPRTATALTPMQVAKAMGIPQNVDVSERSVAILELGGAFQLNDIIAYCKRFQIPMPEITTYFVDGALEQADPNGADGEVGLDICVIAGVAPGCKVKVVFAPNSDQGFIDGLAKCVSLNPDSISISWGSPEDGWAPSSRASMDALFEKALEVGCLPCAAAGDNGSSDGETFGNHTDYPASSDKVLACGGTRLELNPDGSRLSETAWSTSLLNPSGGGGGVSKCYPTTPKWQAGTVANEPAGRRVPDVSANADPATGYEVDIDGTIEQIGGTSAVAPLYAAFQAILNAMAGKHVGNMHTKLYANAGSFYDVTQGSNGGYSAGVGFDCVTGMGVLNGTEFAKALDISAVTESHGLISDSEKLLDAVKNKALKQFFSEKGFVSPHFNESEFEAILAIICAIAGGINAVCAVIPSNSGTRAKSEEDYPQTPNSPQQPDPEFPVENPQHPYPNGNSPQPDPNYPQHPYPDGPESNHE